VHQDILADLCGQMKTAVNLNALSICGSSMSVRVQTIRYRRVPSLLLLTDQLFRVSENQHLPSISMLGLRSSLSRSLYNLWSVEQTSAGASIELDGF
jgi:hypothetical protein